MGLFQESVGDDPTVPCRVCQQEGPLWLGVGLIFHSSCKQPLTPSCHGSHLGQAPCADLPELWMPLGGVRELEGSSGLPLSH